MQKLPDNFFFGIVTAFVCLALGYFLLFSLRLIVVQHYGNPYAFAEPRIQLILILINAVLFRFMMVNLKKGKTGRGILFTTVILTFIYFFLYSHYHFRMASDKSVTEIGRTDVMA